MPFLQNDENALTSLHSTDNLLLLLLFVDDFHLIPSYKPIFYSIKTFRNFLQTETQQV